MIEMIVVAVLAGKGVGRMAEKVITQMLASPLVSMVWVVAPKITPQFAARKKLHVIQQWLGEDSHDKCGINRENMRGYVMSEMPVGTRWVWFCDDDNLPASDFFQRVSELPDYQEPVLVTGRTFNFDGQRRYDICGFEGERPVVLPYDDWENPRWDDTRYANGTIHLTNPAAWELNVPYPDVPGEDPVYSWEFVRCGGRIIFRPELAVTLQKQHCAPNYPQ